MLDIHLEPPEFDPREIETKCPACFEYAEYNIFGNIVCLTCETSFTPSEEYFNQVCANDN